MAARQTRPSPAPLRTAVVLGSDREGRFAPVVRDWVLAALTGRGGHEVDVLDPVELDLPRRYPSGPDPRVEAFRQRVDEADAFVVVTPEYNHSVPAALKALVDLATTEWGRKPLGVVSYGGLSGGLRATEALRVVVGSFDTHTLGDTVSLHGASRAFDGDGVPVDPATDVALARLLVVKLPLLRNRFPQRRSADSSRVPSFSAFSSLLRFKSA